MRVDNYVRPLTHPTELPGGSLATIKGSFEVVTVVRQEGNNVLVERGSGQTTYNRDQLQPYNPDFCPLD